MKTKAPNAQRVVNLTLPGALLVQTVSIVLIACTTSWKNFQLFQKE